MRKTVAFILMAVMLLVCASASATSVAVLYSDTIDDKGWCQAMDDGIKAAIEQGYDIEYTPVESIAIPDAKNTLEQLVENYDIIIVHGAQFTSACTEVAEEYPEQIFVLGTSDQIFGENVFSYMPQSEEPGYINGIIAGLTTKANKVGVVGSSDGGDSARYVRGFVVGLKEVNPDCECMVTWTGSFSDTVGAGDIAKTFVESGCDVIVGSSQQAVGAIRIVEGAENVIFLGQTISQMNDFPAIVPAAADYDYSAVIINVLEQIEGGVTGGTCIPMNYFNHGFVYEFAADSTLLSEEAIAAGNAAIEKLAADVNTVDYLTALD